jgi:hypothetical protein
MAKTALNSAGSILLIVAVAVPVHYLGGLEWPWAIVIGAAGSITLRRLVHGGSVAGLRKPPAAGGSVRR